MFHRTKSTEIAEEAYTNFETESNIPQKAKLRIDYDPGFTVVRAKDNRTEDMIKESRYKNNIIASFRAQKKFLTLEVRDVDVEYDKVCPPATYSTKNPKKSRLKDYVLDTNKNEENSINDATSNKLKNSHQYDKSTHNSKNSSGVYNSDENSPIRNSRSVLPSTERQRSLNRKNAQLLPNLRKFENTFQIKADYNIMNSDRDKKK